MSYKPDARIVIGADIDKSKATILEDLKTITAFINRKNNMPKIILDINLNETRKMFETNLNKMFSNLNIEPLDIKINTTTTQKQVKNTIATESSESTVVADTQKLINNMHSQKSQGKAGIDDAEKIMTSIKSGLEIVKGVSDLAKMVTAMTTATAGATVAAGVTATAVAAVPLAPLIAGGAAIISILSASTQLYDTFTISTEEARASLENSKSQYASTVSNLQTVQEALSATTARMNELNGKGNLNIADQNELDQLSTMTDELRIQNDLLEIQLKLKAQEKNKAFVETVDSYYGDTLGSDGSGSKLDDSRGLGKFGTKKALIDDKLDSYIGKKQKLLNAQQDVINAYNNGDEEVRKAAEKKKEAADADVKGLEAELFKMQSDFAKDSEDVTYEENSEDPFQQMVNARLISINDFNRRLKLVYEGATEMELDFDKVFNDTNNAKDKEELTLLASKKELTAEDVEKYKDLAKAFDDVGVGAEEVAKQINALNGVIEEVPQTNSIDNIINTIATAKSSFSALDSVLEDLRSDSKAISFDSLEGIKEQFGDLGDEYEKSMATISDSKSTYAQVQTAVNNLATAYINQKGILLLADEENQAAIVTSLRSIGVSNAEAVAKRAVINARIEESIAAEVADGNIGDLTDATDDEILSLYGLVKGSDEANKKLKYFALQKMIAANGSLAEALKNDSKGFIETALAAGIAGGAIEKYATITNRIEALQLQAKSAPITHGGLIANKAQLDALLKEAENLNPDIEKQIAEAGKIDINAMFNGSSGSKSDKSSSGTDKNLEAYNDEYAYLQHLRAMDIINSQQYHDRLIALDNKYFKGNKKYISEHRKNLEEVYNLDKSLSDERIADMEHEVAMLGKKENTEFQQIDMYKNIQAELHKSAEARREYLRSIGVANNIIEQDDILNGMSLKWLEINDTIKDIKTNLQTPVKDAHLNALNREKEALESILDMTKELIKQEKEDQIEALEKQKDLYRDIIESRKESLQITERERSYDEDVDDKTANISKLQDRIDVLGRDDSREAALERGKLLEELAVLQKELSKTQHQHSIELQEAALDKELKDYEATKDKEIDALNAFLDDSNALTTAAVDRIKNHSDTLQKELIAWNKTYGTGIETDITDSWTAATTSLEKYSDALQGIIDKQAQIKGIEHDNELADNKYSDYSSEETTAISKMIDNSLAYKNAKTLEEKNALHADNYEQAKKITSDKIEYKLYNGTWRWLKKDGTPLYHTGGIAGDQPSLKQKEMFTILERGEMILNDGQQSAFQKLLGMAKDMLTLPVPQFTNIPNSNFANVVNKSNSISILSPITINGASPGANIMDALKQHGRDIASIVSTELNKK